MDLIGERTKREETVLDSRASPRSVAQVSVVVVNHNRAGLLKECLKSLLNQSVPPLEVIVVDNGSRDESCDLVRSFSNSRIRLVSLSENRGFAEACNIGIRTSQGEFVALLNNDAVADKDWLEQLVAEGNRHPEAGMFACKIRLYGTTLIDKAGHLLFPDGQNRGRGTGEPDSRQYDDPGETLFPDGCAAMYRRELLEETGGFDEDFFAYADDADLGLRARLLGWSCRYVPSAIVHHHHSSTVGAFSEQKVYWIERNRLWLAIKIFPIPLLLLNPFFSVYRWAWNLYAALSAKGVAGRFRREHSLGLLAKTLLLAYRDAIRGFPHMLSKRRTVRRRRRISDLEFYCLLWRYRISALTLALGGGEE
ncbi:MAG TPA: glycosyltransferase family 2 protein [Acidobacteriota bacterium]|nr:glycosyltransferase family 2 protein [Acidobacteriota bacterium]